MRVQVPWRARDALRTADGPAAPLGQRVAWLPPHGARQSDRRFHDKGHVVFDVDGSFWLMDEEVAGCIDMVQPGLDGEESTFHTTVTKSDDASLTIVLTEAAKPENSKRRRSKGFFDFFDAVEQRRRRAKWRFWRRSGTSSPPKTGY